MLYGRKMTLTSCEAGTYCNANAEQHFLQYFSSEGMPQAEGKAFTRILLKQSIQSEVERAEAGTGYLHVTLLRWGLLVVGTQMQPVPICKPCEGFSLAALSNMAIMCFADHHRRGQKPVKQGLGRTGNVARTKE